MTRGAGRGTGRRRVLGRVLAVVAVVAALVVGAPLVALVVDRAGSEPPPPTTTVAAPAPTTTPPAPAPAPVALDTGVAQRAADAADATVTRSGADVGVAVLDLATGTLATNDEGATPMNSASLSKLLTAIDVLARGAEGTVTVSDADRRLISRALGPSDDNAMNALWERFGGAAGITRVVDRLDLADTTAPDDPSQWGEVQLSARDMTTALRFVVDGGLAPADRELVVAAMSSAPATAADGFDQGFGLFDPAQRGAAAAKQGWLCCLQQSVDLHSAGLLDGPDSRFVLAILSTQPFGYPAARSVLDDAANAVRDTVRS